MKSKLKRTRCETNAEIVARSMHRMRNPLMIIATEKGIATKDFKKRFNCNYMSIRNWTMHSPRISTVRKIARKLRIDSIELMYEIMIWREEEWDKNPVAYVRKYIKEMD